MIEMSAEAITARLRLVSALRSETPPRPEVDMKPEAITARLREVSQLRTLCLRLSRLSRGPSVRSDR